MTLKIVRESCQNLVVKKSFFYYKTSSLAWGKIAAKKNGGAKMEDKGYI